MKRTLFFMLSAVLMFVFFYFYDDVFPIASLDLRVTQNEAESIARRYLSGLGFSVKGYDHAVVFDGDEEAMVFLERSVGLKAANELVRKRIPVWRWEVRYFKPLQKESFWVFVNPSGRVDSFAHVISDMDPGPDLSRRRAGPVARNFLLSRNVDLEQYRLVEHSALRKPARTDHRFEWEEKGFNVSWTTDGGEPRKGVLRMAVEVSGDRVDRWSIYLKVPEDFSRKLEGLSATGRLYTLVSIVLSLLFTFASLAWFMIYFKKDRLWLVFALGTGILIAVLMVLGKLNELPILKASYKTTTGFFTYFTSLFVSGLIGSLFVAMEVVLAMGAGEALTRDLFPDSVRSVDQLFRGRRGSSSLMNGIWNGYALGFLILGLVTLFYFLGTRYFSVWLFPDPEYDNILGSYFPFLAPLSVSLVASVSEECVYRLFAVPFLKKNLNSLWLACLLPSMVWAFAHSSYPVFPSYVRGIELTMIGCIFCVGFIYSGFLTVVVAHYVIDAVLISVPLLRSENAYFFASGIIVIGLAALPMAIPLIRRRIRSSS